MSVQLRQIVNARRLVGDRVVDALEPVERNAHAVAIDAANLVGVVLQAHTDAKLPPSAGMEALTLLSEASHLAAQSRAKLGAAHDLLRSVAKQYGIVHAGPPYCPPNEVGDVPHFTGA